MWPGSKVWKRAFKPPRLKTHLHSIDADNNVSQTVEKDLFPLNVTLKPVKMGV